MDRKKSAPVPVTADLTKSLDVLRRLQVGICPYTTVQSFHSPNKPQGTFKISCLRTSFTSVPCNLSVHAVAVCEEKQASRVANT